MTRGIQVATEPVCPQPVFARRSGEEDGSFALLELFGACREPDERIREAFLVKRLVELRIRRLKDGFGVVAFQLVAEDACDDAGNDDHHPGTAEGLGAEEPARVDEVAHEHGPVAEAPAHCCIGGSFEDCLFLCH
ncbi:MAG: hypothetical protein IPI85_04965 [Dehalococcoidia bacterium]|nr:hypothetical protein [Dehalococcoidia bacterium]